MLDNGMLLPFDDTEPQEVAVCKGCSESVYDNEEQIEVDGEVLHDDAICIANYVRNHLT